MMEFIPKEDIKRVWSFRWAILTAIIAAVPVAYLTLPEDWLPTIPEWVKAVFAYSVLISASTTAAVRVIKQPIKEKSGGREVPKDET